MKTNLRNATLLLIVVPVMLAVAWIGWSAGVAAGAGNQESSAPMVAHNVYFTLKDTSPEAQQKLVAACQKYLSNHPGTVLFAAGTLADLARPVNDRDWQVGLHVIFKDRAAHDAYQTAPLHLQFIAENKDNWDKVRVFDTDAKGATN